MLKVLETGDEFASYGLWNCLAAFANGELVGVVPAHDGDFFPECPSDHVRKLKRAVGLGTRGEALEHRTG